MRKVNFAAIVNEKTPQIDAYSRLLRANYCNNNGLCLLLICWTRDQLLRHNNMYISW
jgi:hypothetical protein